MPIYEYACKKCEAEFEVSQRITDEPLKRYLCPQCGKRVAVTKLISRSSFHLKGSGWYATDYAKNGKPSSKSDEAKPGEAKGETKKGDGKDGSAKADTSDSSASSKSDSSSVKASPSSASADSASSA